jgi:uncharacterized membrane protein YphA (DoxX/SURF4 family)
MTRRQDLAQLLLRLALGAGFILPVLDRFGFLGGPGSKGVAWGSWPVFVRYAHSMLPFLPASLAGATAGMATAAEIVFGLCLIIGFQVRPMAAGAALLTFIFGLCMAVFLGIAAPFNYPVFVFTGGAWLLATIPVSRWGVDALIRSRTHRRRHRPQGGHGD